MQSFADIAFPLRLSLQVALVSTLGVALIGVPLAYLLATREFRYKQILDTALTLPLVLPPIVTGYYLLLLVGKHGAIARVAGLLGMPAPEVTFTWVAAVLAAFVIGLPFTVRTSRAAFESVDRDLVSMSLTMGRSELSTAWLVVLPLSARGVVAGLVLSFARSLGEFGATAMVAGNIPGRTNTVPLEIHNAVLAGDWPSAAVLVAVLTVFSAGFMMASARLMKRVTW